MADAKITLRHLHGNIYEAVSGGLEPLFQRSIERGEVQFGHQSGYGYLPESRVTVVPPVRLLGYICKDDLERLPVEGSATIYEVMQEMEFLPKAEQFAVYIASTANAPYCATLAGPCSDGCPGRPVQCGKPGEMHGDCWRVKPPPPANGEKCDV